MKQRTLLSLFLASACCLLGSAAYAAVVNNPTKTQVPSNPQVHGINYPELPGPLNGLPISVVLQSGIADYTGTKGSNVRVGPVAGVSVGVMDHDLYGGEVSFEMSNNGVNSGPLQSAAVLYGIPRNQSIWRYNVGVSGKLGPGINTNQGKFRPYALAGLGGSLVNVTDGAVPPYKNDLMAEIPVGGGLDYEFGTHLIAGFRGVYRILVFDNFTQKTATGDTAGGGMFSTTLSVGGRF